MTDLPKTVELRTRVVCTLPFASTIYEFDSESQHTVHYKRNVIKAAQAFIGHVKSLQRHSVKVEGFTKSRPGAYEGAWYSTGEGRKPAWEYDEILQITMDVELKPDSPAMRVLLREIRYELALCYFGYDVHQEDLWVIAYPVHRQCRTELEDEIWEAVERSAAKPPLDSTTYGNI